MVLLIYPQIEHPLPKKTASICPTRKSLETIRFWCYCKLVLIDDLILTIELKEFFPDHVSLNEKI